MKLVCCGREFKSKKSLSNHVRWHNKAPWQDNFKKVLSESRMGEKNIMWKGDSVSYGALHDWIRDHKLKVELCEICNKKKAIDLSNISGKYKRDINDFKWTCRTCHMINDGRLEYLHKVRKR